MNKILKNGLLGISILLLFFLSFSQACMAEEDVPSSPPMLPMTVTGAALIEGTPASNGTIITAYLNGNEYLANTLSGNYSVFIPGTAEDEGKMVTFKVDGKDASSSVAWKSGGIVTLDLPDGKAVYLEITESNSTADSNSDSASDSNSDSASDSNSNSNSDSATDSNSKSNSNSNSNSNQKTGSESLTDTKEQGVSAQSSKVDSIKTSIPEPDVKTLKSTAADSKNKVVADSSKSSSNSESAPGFLIVYAVAGILLLAFGSNFGKGSRRKP
jgi:hypothetical protein